MENCVANWPLILQFLTVLLSWPVVTLLLVGYVLWLVRGHIGDLVRRLEEWSGFGTTAKFGRGQGASPLMPPGTALDNLDALREAVRHEWIFNNMFGSQFDFLMLLSGKDGTVEERDRYYAEHVRRAGKDSSTLSAWIHWMERAELIRVDPQSGVISLDLWGRRFLAHLANAYPKVIPPRWG